MYKIKKKAPHRGVFLLSTLHLTEKVMAEARGFEPPRRLPAHTISSRAPSTTRPRFLSNFNTIFRKMPHKSQKYVIIKTSPLW